MAKSVAWLTILLLGVTGARTLQAEFFQICRQPPLVATIQGEFGPKLLELTNTAAIDAAIALVAATDDEDNRASTRKRLQDSAATNQGIFMSSPFVKEDVKRGEKLTEICVIFGFGGVAWGAFRAVRDNTKFLEEKGKRVKFVDEAGKQAIANAIAESDAKCLDSLKGNGR